MNQELDYRLLDRELDRVKSQVFLGKNASFLGPLMASLNVSWTLDIETACTNSISLWWNPHFFMRLPVKTRKTVLKHELWHPALLHMLRRGDRDPKIWNYAADTVINNMLDDEGDSFEGLGIKPWLDHSYDGWGTEAVYDDYLKKNQEELDERARMAQWINPLNGLGEESDIVEPDGDDAKTLEHTIINNIVAATHASALGGGCDNMPGEVELTLKRFLAPKLPWDQILRNFFNELANQDYSWARPNRRYADMYLPSMVDDIGLDHLIYFEDVSGSITDADALRFNSEFNYVKEQFNPEKMTMVQFDTKIQKVDVFMKEDPFDEIKIVGRGGTSLACVRDYIIEHKPTAVVVFSDLQCNVMEPLPHGMDIPIIWVALNNHCASVPHGQIVYLNE